MSPCPSNGSLAPENSQSDPEYGVHPDRYSFHCNDEVWDSQYYFCHRLHAHEMAHVRTESDGTHPAVREVEVRGWDATKNLEDIVDVIYEDMRSDGLPLLRLKLLKKTHVKRSRKETIACLQFKRVEDCFHMLGRYHKMDTYHAFAANGRFLVGQPIPGSAKYASSWTLSSAGPDIALRY